MKKLLTVTLVTLMMLSLAACGEGGMPITPQSSLSSSTGADTSSTDSEKIAKNGFFLESVQLDEYSNGLNIYLADNAIDSTVFTEGILTLEAGKNSFTIDFTNKKTTFGLVQGEDHFTPVITVAQDGSSTQNALYARDKSMDGVTVIELSFLGENELATKDWSAYKKASVRRGGSTTELTILDEPPISQVDTAIRVFPDEVYDKGFGARNGDSVHFVPKTNDYIILFSTDSEFEQTAYLTSFDNDKKAVQFTIREVSDWENVSNLNEVLARNNGQLVDDAMYYEYSLSSLLRESMLPTSQKFHCVYMAHSGDMGSRGLGGSFDFYYPQPLTNKDYQSDFENVLTKDNCEILRGISVKSDDYIVNVGAQINNPAQSTTEVIGREADGLKAITKPVPINEAYSYHQEEIYVWGNDGNCIQYAKVDICESETDAIEYMKAYKYNAFGSSSSTRKGRFIILKETVDDSSDTKLYALSGARDPEEWYMSKPYLTKSQANAELRRAGQTD